MISTEWKLSIARISFTDISSVYFASQYLLRQVPLRPWGQKSLQKVTDTKNLSHFTHLVIAKYDKQILHIQSMVTLIVSRQGVLECYLL